MLGIQFRLCLFGGSLLLNIFYLCGFCLPREKNKNVKPACVILLGFRLLFPLRNERTTKPTSFLLLGISVVESFLSFPIFVYAQKKDENVKPTYNIPLGTSLAESFLSFSFFVDPRPTETEQQKYIKPTFTATHTHAPIQYPVLGSPVKIGKFDFIGREGILPYDVSGLPVRCARDSSQLSAESIPVFSLSSPEKRRKDIFTFLLMFA